MDFSHTDLTNLPDPSRLIFGLRDTGYDFYTAAADIVDNSIAAGATEIRIRVYMASDGRKTVLFGDNGSGMTPAGLFEAMRYGAPQRSNLKSLGKFGLGLKTASTSICRRFSLISRVGQDQPLAKLTWDLDHVEQVNRWEMTADIVTTTEEEAFVDLCGAVGTLVAWSKCDRLLSKEYAQAGGAYEKTALASRVKSLTEHLALVFHRFLDHSDDAFPNVRIFIDDNEVVFWNPFFPSRAEQVLPEHARVLRMQIEDGSIHNSTLNAWILPHSKDLTKEEEDLARISSRAQGFYIYREGRLIHHGGWLGVFRSDDPHYSLLRVEFNFGYQLDDAFKIDVKKSRILFDPALEDNLRETLKPFWNEADRRYRRKTSEAAAEAITSHAGANKTIGQTATRTAAVVTADAESQTVTVNNNRGGGIKLHVSVNDHVNPKSVFVEAVDDIMTGHIWEPAMRSTGDSGHRIGVRINKHHDFFQKIYLRAAANGDAVEGIDFLLWAYAAAEMNNTDRDLAQIFEDIRDEISANLRRLLKDTPEPTATDIKLSNSVD
jgi:hypothetical protein